MLRIIAFLWCSLLALATFAQSTPLPKSNIYLFKVEQKDDGTLSFLQPRFLTAFNPNGYNNTPSFFSDTELYISSKEPNAVQADLYKLDLEQETKLQVTATPETELAPERMPGFYDFSAVRIEKDGRNDIFRLWQFPVDQLTNGKAGVQIPRRHQRIPVAKQPRNRRLQRRRGRAKRDRYCEYE